MPSPNDGIFGTFKFGQTIFSQDSNDPYTPAATPDNINSDLVLIVRERATGNVKLIISDAMKDNSITDMQFEFLDSGCGSFSFTLGKLPDTEISFKDWVEIYLFRSATPWYTGTIEARPHPKATRNVAPKYGGHGFIYQLDTCLIDKIYPAGMELSAVAIDIMQTFVCQKTNVQYVDWKISPTGVLLSGNLQFQKRTAKQAFQTLADIAQNFVFGVDEFRHFFFQPVSPDLNANGIKFVSKHLDSFPVVEDPAKIINRIYVNGGSIQDGSNFLVTVNDTVSQDAYGIIEQVLNAPEITSIADATRWGNYQLTKYSSVLQKAQLKNVQYDRALIKPTGKARIWKENPGVTDYIDLYIKKTSYKVSKSGVIMDMEVGEVDQIMENFILDLQRNIAQQAALQQANVGNLS